MKLNFNMNRDLLNSYLFALSFFFSAITIPLKAYTSSGFIVWVLFGVVLVISLVINYNEVIKKYFIAYLLFFSIFFILSYFFSNQNENVLSLYFNFIKFSVTPVFLFQYIKNSDLFFSTLYKVARVTYLFLISSIPFVVDGTIDYMTFGISLSSTLILIYFNDVRKSNFNLFNFLIILLGLCAIFIFGNRMSFLSSVVCLLFMKVLFINARFVFKLAFLFICCVISAFIYFQLLEILLLISDFLTLYDIQSYGIQKLILMLNTDIATSSSGREGIYLEAINMINDNSYLPYSLSYYRENNSFGAPYPHNFILELLFIVGLPGLILLLMAYIYFVWKVIKIKEKSLKFFILTILIYSILKLSLSSTFWVEPFFWLSFFAYFSFKKVEG